MNSVQNLSLSNTSKPDVPCFWQKFINLIWQSRTLSKRLSVRRITSNRQLKGAFQYAPISKLNDWMLWPKHYTICLRAWWKKMYFSVPLYKFQPELKETGEEIHETERKRNSLCKKASTEQLQSPCQLISIWWRCRNSFTPLKMKPLWLVMISN